MSDTSPNAASAELLVAIAKYLGLINDSLRGIRYALEVLVAEEVKKNHKTERNRSK